MARSRRALLFGAALSATSLVACAGILGLDEFTKGECAGAKCGDGGDLDVVVPDAGDAGSDGASDGALGTEPVAWPKWPMPNYKNPLDSGVVLPHALDYDTSVPDEVTDRVTHLVWRQKVIGSDVTLQDAQAACKALPGGPWRVPKRIELVTLLDYGRDTAPFIDDAAFPGFGASAVVWTSSVVYEYDLTVTPPSYKPLTDAWVVDFGNGQVSRKPFATALRVLCVKGLL